MRMRSSTTSSSRTTPVRSSSEKRKKTSPACSPSPKRFAPICWDDRRRWRQRFTRGSSIRTSDRPRLFRPTHSYVNRSPISFNEPMPRRDDINSVLIIGSGPIVIGQACEFDYSGTQACRVLREEGMRVILLNSNPATIMTDPEFADATYIEPITPDFVEKVIAAERPDAILATLGGQTALNTAVALHERGVLEKYN